MPAPGYILVLLLTVIFTLATWLQPLAVAWTKGRAQSNNLLAVTLGDARRLFANHFFIKADVYFHSGYYPSIFDQGRTNQLHIAEQAGQGPGAHQGKTPEEEEKEEDFLGPPRDWIDKFGRNFYLTEHTHLSGGHEDEMLPWLKIAAELDPQKVEVYTVASYWLRGKLNRPDAARDFLREGLRANPNSYEILLELGRVYAENYHDPDRARNLWQLAERKLKAHERATGEVDIINERQILLYRAQLEEAQGNYQAAADAIERLCLVLPGTHAVEREELEKRRAELLQKANTSPATPAKP